jgi:hypothetical protein
MTRHGATKGREMENSPSHNKDGESNFSRHHKPPKVPAALFVDSLSFGELWNILTTRKENQVCIFRGAHKNFIFLRNHKSNLSAKKL